MALGYITGTIAGVTLTLSGTPLRGVILDGGRLKTSRAINTRVGFAPGETPPAVLFAASMDIDYVGTQFGVEFEFLPVSIRDSIVAAVEAAVDSDSFFIVDVTNDWDSIDADCAPDGPDWITYSGGRSNTETIPQVTMRFRVASVN
jgi:hypothetical protein